MEVTLRPSGAIQARIRAANAANGWEVPSDPADRTAIVARLALAISEVAEAIEAVRKPEVDDAHLAEELADAVIRLLDLGSGLGIVVLDDDPIGTDLPGSFDVRSIDGLVASLGVVASTIGMLLDVVASATGSVAPSRDVIAGGLQAPCLQVEALATVLGLDLVGAIDAKIARNVARGYRHGGRAI